MSPAPVIACVDDEPAVLRSVRERCERGLHGVEIAIAGDASEEAA